MLPGTRYRRARACNSLYDKLEISLLFISKCKATRPNPSLSTRTFLIWPIRKIRLLTELRVLFNSKIYLTESQIHMKVTYRYQTSFLLCFKDHSSLDRERF